MAKRNATKWFAKATWCALGISLITAPAAATDAAKGKATYETRCSPCHGVEGGGDGPAAAAVVPKPRNFRDPQFWTGRTAVQLRLVVQQGRPGTLMVPFEGVLSDDEIDDVVAYIQTFRPKNP